MDILDYCDVCGEGHTTELCPELGLTSVQTEVDQLSTRARLTLPSFVEVVDNGSGLVGVVAKETIPIKTQMGPYEAKRTTHIFDDSGFFTLKLIAKDGTTVCLDTTDENECNWMCLVRAAASENSKNCIAYQLGNNIFYNTSREITPEEELLVWYAPHFARKLGKPSEPDGETRILLGHRIEPLTSDLLLDTEAPTVLQLTEELHKDDHDNQEQQSDEEGSKVTVPSSQPSIEQRTGEIKKAFYCPRCGNTFDTQTEMVQHLREHILRADGKPRRGRGRPRKHLSNQRSNKIINNRSAENGLFMLDNEHEELKVNKQSKTYERKRKLDSTEDMSDYNDDGDEDDDFVDVDATDKEYSPDKDIRLTGTRTQPRRSTRGKHTKLDDDYIYVFKKTGVKTEELSDYDKAVENNKLETEADKKDKRVVKTENKAVNTGSVEKKGRGRPKKVKQDELAKNYVIIVQEASQTDSSRGNNNKVLSVEQVKESLTALKGKENPDKLISALKEKNSETEHEITDLGKLDETGINTEYLFTIVGDNSLVIMENSKSEIDQAQPISKTASLVLSQSDMEQISVEEGEPGSALEGEFTENVGMGESQDKSEHLENHSNENMTVDNKQDSEEKVSVTIDKEMNLNEVVTEGTSKDFSTDTVDKEVDSDNQSENPENTGGLNNDLNNELMAENNNRYDEKEETTSLNIDKISASTLNQHINEINKEGASLTEKDSVLVMFEETKDGKYGCAVCDEKFALEIEAISHFTNHTSETPTCKDCGREFKGLDSLLVHRKMCKQYSCDICQQAFKTPQYLYRHMVIHTDVFRCEKCQKTFSRKDSMQKHILKCCPSLAEHYKIYYCEVCLRVFSKESGLMRHVEKCKSVQCQSCKKVFTSNTDMTTHACKTSESEECGKYSCGLCSKYFQSMYYLKRHQITHVSDHTCQKCKKTFTNKEDLESHKALCKTLEMIRKYGSWKCEVCSQSFGNTKEFRSHYLEHSHPYQCEKCFKRFERMVALESHECEVTELLNCTVCLKTFKNQINLDKHTKEHSCMKFQCSACNELFHSKANAKDHNCIIEATADGEAQIISISDVKEVCAKCGKSFSSKSNLTKHMTLHGEKKFQCTYCSKHFHLEVYLREHITCVHYNIFKFQCNVCGRLLKSKTGLIAHNRIFHAKNVEVFPCGKCSKVFKQKGNLRSHMFSHSTERKFRCDICPRAFKYPDQLSRHKFEHKLVPTFRCVHCEKDFIRPYDLKRHLQVYHSGYVYVCGVCSARCGHRHTLVRHYKRKHPESLHLTTQHGYLDSLLKHVNEVYESQNPDSKLSVLGENETDGETEQTPGVLSQVLSQEAAEALQSLALGHATAKQFQLLQDKGLFVHNLVNNVANELVDGLNQVIVPQDSYIFQSQGQSESQETENGVSMVTVSTDTEETVGSTGLVQNADGTISINGIQAIPQTIEGLEPGENQIVILQIIEPESQGQRDMIHLNEEQAALIDLHQNREGEVIQLGEDQQGQVIQLTQENLLQEVLKQNVELSKHSQIQTVFVNRDGSYQTSLEETDIEPDQSLTIADSVINQNGDVAMDSDTVIPIQDGELDIQAPMVYSQDVTCTDDV